MLKIWQIYNSKINRGKIINVFLVASFFSLTLFLFGPSQIYFTNTLEFDLSFFDIYLYFIALSCLSILLIWMLLLVLGRSVYQRVISLLFVLSILLWIQGNILVWDYGVFDGREIAWNKYVIKGCIDIGIWLLFIICAFIKPKFIYKIIRKACIAFMLVQLISVTLYAAYAPDALNYRKYGFDESTNFIFSPKRNVIILVLDAFRTDIFQEIINEDNNYSDIFQGFTYYRNALSAFPCTYLSVPSFLSGQCYDNSIPIHKFLKNTYLKNSILKVLKENGFLVNLYQLYFPSIYLNEKVASNVIKRKIYHEDIKKYIAYIYDITLFRHTPHFIKKYIYNNQMFFLTQIFSKKVNKQGSVARLPQGKNGSKVSTEGIEQNFQNNLRRNSVGESKGISQQSQQAMQNINKISESDFETKHKIDRDIKFINKMASFAAISSDKYTFKFFHLWGMHSPWMLNERFEYESSSKDRQACKKQAKAMLQLTKIFLNTLDEIGAYDNSMIFVIGDHGVDWGLLVKIPADLSIKNNKSDYSSADGRALPLILVKPFNLKGKMDISDAPVSLVDIPKTIISELNLKGDFPGISMFTIKESDIRERRFFNYRPQDNIFKIDYLPDIEEHLVLGFSWFKESWRSTGKHFKPRHRN